MVRRPSLVAGLLSAATVLSLVAPGPLRGHDPGNPAGAVVEARAGTPPEARASDIPTVLVSRPLRESAGLSIGDIVSLSADPAGAHPRQFRVAGEYEPIPDPMRLGLVRHEVRVHLPDLIEMTADPADPLAAESVDAVNVSLAEPAGAAAFARDVSARAPGLVVRSTIGSDDRAAPFVVLERFHLAIAVVTVIASSIFLLALMLMLVDERRETIGILRLIGFKRRRILLHVLAEGAVIAAAGAAFGVLLSVALQGGVNRFFQWRYDTALVFVRITPRIALRSVVFAVPLGVLAAIASSWTLLRREIISLTRR
jgi:putative ABC transport system permease protein